MLLKKVLTVSIVFACCAVSKAEIVPSPKDSVLKKTVLKPALKNPDSFTIPIPYSERTNAHYREILSREISPLGISLNRIQNAYIQAYVNRYTSPKYRNHLSEMLGLSQYYFPIFERVFNEKRIPKEIKYLAIVESSLNPHAVSRVGATGPWQFMYATAKGYGLDINNYIDEREDPVAASYAAADYLLEAYDMYQDWFLAIASYNCGRGNVNRAIRRSGKKNPSFWDIRAYLPNETRNYVPSFIALYKVLSRAEDYDIYAAKSDLAVDTDIIMVERTITLDAVSKALRMDPNQLALLNPAYKKAVLQGTRTQPARLVVPKVPKKYYAALYQVLQGPDATPPLGLAAIAPRVPKPMAPLRSYIAYKVQDGDTLEAISKRFKGNSVSSLKALNRIEDEEEIIPGTTLKVRWD